MRDEEMLFIHPSSLIPHPSAQEEAMERETGPKAPKGWSRRSVLLALAAASLAVPACEVNQLFSWNGGKPVLFGYGTTPNYDKRYKTIRLKIFKNPTFWAVVPVPGMEMHLTEALV